MKSIKIPTMTFEEKAIGSVSLIEELLASVSLFMVITVVILEK